MTTRRGRGRAPVRERVGSGLAELVADADHPRGWTLRINGTPQSHVDLDDPTNLQFEYVRRLGRVVDSIAPARRPVRALHLGGGGLTLPRYIAATRPRSTQQVVEVDGALVALVRRELPLERGWRVKVRTGDARDVLARAPRGGFDLIALDVFADAMTPAHLTSVEFLHEVAAALDGAGVWAANVADGAGSLSFARAQVATAQAVFGHTGMITDPAVRRGRRYGNLILLGSRRELPIERLTTLLARDPFPAQVEHGPQLTRFTGGARPITDATAADSPAPPEGTF